MKTNFMIRQTSVADYSTVYSLIKTAFETAEHSDGDEQDFTDQLRQGGNYIPELDLVAVHDGRLIGHILLTKTEVTQPDGSRFEALMVAPLSVLAEYRNAGVGSALMQEGLRLGAALGYGAAFLLGDPDYYRRFGFELSYLKGIRHAGFPAEYVMVKELLPGAIGSVTGMVQM